MPCPLPLAFPRGQTPCRATAQNRNRETDAGALHSCVCVCARACTRVCVSVHLCLLRSTVRPPPHSRPRLCHYHLGAPLCYPFTAAPTSPRQLLATAALHLRGSVISRPCYVNEITPCGTSCSWLCSRGVIAEAHPRCPARHGAVPRYH